MRPPGHHRRLCWCASQPRALALCWLKRSPPSAGAVPVFFNYVWNCKQETNVCIFLGIQAPPPAAPPQIPSLLVTTTTAAQLSPPLPPSSVRRPQAPRRPPTRAAGRRLCPRRLHARHCRPTDHASRRRSLGSIRLAVRLTETLSCGTLGRGPHMRDSAHLSRQPCVRCTYF